MRPDDRDPSTGFIITVWCSNCIHRDAGKCKLNRVLCWNFCGCHQTDQDGASAIEKLITACYAVTEEVDA
jgi:hypothetical protein